MILHFMLPLQEAGMHRDAARSLGLKHSPVIRSCSCLLALPGCKLSATGVLNTADYCILHMQVVRQLPRSWRLMLVTFRSAVSVYQLANRGLVTADVVSGEWQDFSSRQKPSQFHFGSPEPLHVASLQSCQDAAEHVISSWRSVAPPSCWCLNSFAWSLCDLLSM